MYCPCCKEEFVPGEEFCLDCLLPLIDGKSFSRVHLCDCDEFPFGKYIANRFEGGDGGDMVAITAAVSSLTGIRNGDVFKAYIDKLLAFNR